jgi:hypothetical protein
VASEDKLDELIEDHLITMMKVDALKVDIRKLKDQYEKDRDAAAAAGATKEEKEAFKAKQQALADGLPGLTKGTLSAIEAFRQTPPDNIVGSAAIMDICAGLATTLGGLSTASCDQIVLPELGKLYRQSCLQRFPGLLLLFVHRVSDVVFNYFRVIRIKVLARNGELQMHVHLAFKV